MKFLIVDDHSAVREAVSASLAREFPAAQVRVSASVENAIALMSTEEFDCLILDLSLPGRGGLEVLREAKDQQRSCRVIIHTMHAETQLGVAAVKAGADGYVTKDRPLEDLLTAVRRVLSRRRYYSEELVEKLADDSSKHNGEAVSLSLRETQVLTALSSGKAPSEIAAVLNLSPKTISTYRMRLLEKLGLDTTAALIAYGLDRGLGARPRCPRELYCETNPHSGLVQLTLGL